MLISVLCVRRVRFSNPADPRISDEIQGNPRTSVEKRGGAESAAPAPQVTTFRFELQMGVSSPCMEVRIGECILIHL